MFQDYLCLVECYKTEDTRYTKIYLEAGVDRLRVRSRDGLSITIELTDADANHNAVLVALGAGLS